MVPVLVLSFVALWFILRGDLFYVLPCVILFLCFFSPFSIAITSLGEERANLSAFRTFVRFVLVWICWFSVPLGVWEGCGLLLWHSLDFSLTFYILRGDMFYVLPCVIFFVCVFFSPFSIAITSLGEERVNFSVFCSFVRFALVLYCLFSPLFGVWVGLRFVIVALPGLFFYLFLDM